jgi:cytochrome bd-type quinol oxidase subunit 2
VCRHLGGGSVIVPLLIGVALGDLLNGLPINASHKYTGSLRTLLQLSIFTELYPHVMISSTDPAFSLTVSNSASGSYSLTVMTVVVAIFLPVVLAYALVATHDEALIDLADEVIRLEDGHTGQ